MALPQQFGYGLVTGGFQLAVGDRDDADRNPDGVPAEGTVSFRPQASRIIIPGERVVTPKSVECSLDADGYLYLPSSVTPGEDGKVPEADRGVYLVANDTPEATPQDWTYEVTVSLTGQSQWRFPIAVTTDSEQDISTLAPVDSSGGTPIIRGPEGPRGKPGQDGTMASIVAGDGIDVDATDPANPIVSATGEPNTGTRNIDVASGTAGGATISRTADVVRLDIFSWQRDDSNPSAAVYQVPVGFRPTAPLYNMLATNRDNAATAVTFDLPQFGGMLAPFGSAPSGRIQMHWSWTTADPWPTTLPGTPA